MAFFVELGLELDGETRIEGRWIDRIVGLEGVQADIAMMRIPDGRGRLELARFHAPSARGVRSRSGEHAGHPSCRVRGTGHRDVLYRFRAHGAELVGELAQYENIYRLCYVRGPDGIIIEPAEQIG